MDASLIRLLRSVQLNDPSAEGDSEAANNSGRPRDQEQAPQKANPPRRPRLQYPEGETFVINSSGPQDTEPQGRALVNTNSK